MDEHGGGLIVMGSLSARSPALAAFGGDSAVESLSAVVVLWVFRLHASAQMEHKAAPVSGGLLFLLAAYVVVASAMSLLGYGEPKASSLGIAGGGRVDHALAGTGETPSVGPDRQRRSQGGRC